MLTEQVVSMLGGLLLGRRSKKQTVMVRSSAKADFRSMALGICELL